jgi:hypothetical protein
MIYSISDLHLSLSVPTKAMDKFGPVWFDCHNKLKTNWNNIVKPGDTVIVPGDISWCTRLHETYDDFKFLNDLNGIKMISKGNHDYWFSTKKKVRDHFYANFTNLFIIEKDSYNYRNEYIIAGFKGFNSQSEDKIYKEQLTSKYISLKILLSNIREKYSNIPIILSCHYPPVFTRDNKEILIFHNLFLEYNVKICLYGHVHENYENYIINKPDIQYHLVSADYLQFKPKLII